jgi:hypothetical protein
MNCGKALKNDPVWKRTSEVDATKEWIQQALMQSGHMVYIAEQKYKGESINKVIFR